MIDSQIYTRKDNHSRNLLTAEDAARILCIGVSTVYLLLQRGELTPVRIGRSVRVRPEDLEKFIESKTGTPGPE